jgi:hypothetical protein
MCGFGFFKELERFSGQLVIGFRRIGPVMKKEKKKLTDIGFLVFLDLDYLVFLLDWIGLVFLDMERLI